MGLHALRGILELLRLQLKERGVVASIPCLDRLAIEPGGQLGIGLDERTVDLDFLPKIQANAPVCERREVHKDRERDDQCHREQTPGEPPSRCAQKPRDHLRPQSKQYSEKMR